uniref:Uncharacterized protein n=1 Tax=Poecilia formosa TaxID=48698 RepID=A0A096LZ12_POEFO
KTRIRRGTRNTGGIKYTEGNQIFKIFIRDWKKKCLSKFFFNRILMIFIAVPLRMNLHIVFIMNFSPCLSNISLSYILFVVGFSVC